MPQFFSKNKKTIWIPKNPEAMVKFGLVENSTTGSYEVSKLLTSKEEKIIIHFLRNNPKITKLWLKYPPSVSFALEIGTLKNLTDLRIHASYKDLNSLFLLLESQSRCLKEITICCNFATTIIDIDFLLNNFVCLVKKVSLFNTVHSLDFKKL
jgi:hypothetical protein